MTIPLPPEMNASPQMSDNCWYAITEALSEKRQYRVLEWGSGASTLAFLKYGLQQRSNENTEKFVLVSIEHDPRWVRSVLANAVQLLEPSATKCEVLIAKHSEKLGGSQRNTGSGAELESEHLLYYDLCFPRWAFKPGLFESPNRVMWLARRLPHHVFVRGWTKLLNMTRSSTQSNLSHMRTVEVDLLESFLDNVPRDCRQIIRLYGDSVDFCYHLIPPNLPRFSSRWSKDGMFWEFEDYVMAPVEPPFDVILVDGRARVSCIKRILRDGLLAEGGYLFLHDACSDYYQEAIRLLDGCYFIDGSGIRTDGTVLQAHAQKFWVKHGTSQHELRRDFSQELLVYQG